MAKQKILILGGGFGGVKAALELCRSPQLEVTLVSQDDIFRYYPALYHSATGGARQVSAIPLKQLLSNHPVKFVKARALGLDRNKQVVKTKGGGNLEYDKLIVALGMTTNYFGIKGLKELSYGIKSIEEVERLKQHLHRQLSQQHKPDSHYLVVGGGPTGVELVGMLPSYLSKIAKNHGIDHKSIKVELIEAAPRILPNSPRDISRATTKRLRKLGVVVHTKQKVEAQTADNLIINGQPVSSHTVIWTAGLACNPFLADNDFAMSPHHKALVNQYLQAEENIFVIGDNAQTKYSGLAQTALYDALFVSHNLLRQLDGKPFKKYKPKRPVYVTPTGPNWASVVWGKIHLVGRVGWWVRELADLVAYHDYQPWWPAAERWLAMNDTEESCPLCS